MKTKTFTDTEYGTITVKNVMVDIDDTNLEEGIEIYIKELDKVITLVGFYIENLSQKEIEELIELNIT